MVKKTQLNLSGSTELNPFNRDSPYYFSDCLVNDGAVEHYLGFAKGTIAVKRSRGSWPITTRKAGSNNRTRVGDVLEHYVPLGAVA